ncbi:MAG: hypothetical protein ACRD1O_08135, partial [Terriglobia bacterium]
LLPFFIEWHHESVHPSAGAPGGCRLDRFVLHTQAGQEIEKACRELGIDVVVEAAEKPFLRASISGPKGEVELTS